MNPSSEGQEGQNDGDAPPPYIPQSLKNDSDDQAQNAQQLGQCEEKQPKPEESQPQRLSQQPLMVVAPAPTVPNVVKASGVQRTKFDPKSPRTPFTFSCSRCYKVFALRHRSFIAGIKC